MNLDLNPFPPPTHRTRKMIIFYIYRTRLLSNGESYALQKLLEIQYGTINTQPPTVLQIQVFKGKKQLQDTSRL
jgi:hypothetical protein